MLGWFWSLPVLPIGFPSNIPRPPPPPRLPNPPSEGGSLGCIFGCGGSNNNNNNNNQNQNNDNTNTKNNNNSNSVSNSKMGIQTSKSTSSSSCSSKAIPLCTEKVELLTSISGTSITVQTRTSTECTKITACTEHLKTVTTTTGRVTFTSSVELCGPTCSSCLKNDHSANTSSTNPSKIAKRRMPAPVDYGGDPDRFMFQETDRAVLVPHRGSVSAGGSHQHWYKHLGTSRSLWPFRDFSAALQWLSCHVEVSGCRTSGRCPSFYLESDFSKTSFITCGTGMIPLKCPVFTNTLTQINCSPWRITQLP